MPINTGGQQTSFGIDPARGIPGAKADGALDAYSITRFNPGVAQVATVTVDTANNDTDYSVLINGVPSDFTSDGSATTTEIVAGLLAAIDANAFNGIGLSFDVSTAADDPDLIITADADDTAFIITVSGATLSVVATTAPAGAIPFGYGVAEGATADTIRLPSATGDTLAGIALYDPNIPISATVTQYPKESTVSVMRKGRIYVKPEVTGSVVLGAAVYVRYTADASFGRGSIRHDDDSSTAALLSGAVFATLPDDDGIAIVELNKP